MSIEVWGGGSVGGLGIPDNLTLSAFKIGSVDSQGNFYTLFQGMSVPQVARKYDKKFNLLNEISVSNIHVTGFSPSGYVRGNAVGDGIEIRSLTGTLLGFFSKPNTNSAYFGVRDNDLLWYEPTTYDLQRLNFSGTLLQSYGGITDNGGRKWFVNKKKNYVLLATSGNVPSFLKRIDKTGVATTINEVREFSYGLDLVNW